MTDWPEAGRKADAHRVRDLYRGSFGSDAKTIARSRVIEAMRAADVTTVLDLWGGGMSAAELVRAGFRVISVDDGSMVLTDKDQPVSRSRKRRALEYAALEDGYEARFGKAETFASEADGAYLDFCGPWTASTRRAVQACRHMKAVVVTLTPDHDVSTDATSPLEREMAYQLFLKMAWSEKPRWEAITSGGHVRRLLDYRRPRGYAVFVYLLARQHLKLPALTLADRLKTRPDKRERVNTISRQWYRQLSAERKQAIYRRQQARLGIGPKDRICPQCDLPFVKLPQDRGRKYCSDACSKEAHYRQSRARLERLAAVSGTAAEAVKD